MRRKERKRKEKINSKRMKTSSLSAVHVSTEKF